MINYRSKHLKIIIAIILVLIVFSHIRLAKALEIGFVGMQVQGLSVDISNALGLSVTEGVLVRDIALGEASAMR